VLKRVSPDIAQADVLHGNHHGAAEPQPNLPTEGNEAKEGFLFQRNASSNFAFIAVFCGESLFTKGNQGNESFCSRA